MIHSQTDDLRGNIVFFMSYGDTFLEKAATKIVQEATHGPYVHCEIVYEKDTQRGGWVTIGSKQEGVRYGYISAKERPYHMVGIWTLSKDMQGNVIPIDTNDLNAALGWARAHIGMQYSYADNINQAIDLLWKHCPIHLSQPDCLNCSNFVAAFLERVGVILPDSFHLPSDVSPNDLAEFCGLLPLRKRL